MIDGKYMGAITREQFLFFEMKVTAQLYRQGLKDSEIIERIKADNLFQNPTEKSLGTITRCCLKRLKNLNNEALVNGLCDLPSESAKQICLYSMMKYYDLVWDFMIQVVAEKFRTRNMSFTKADVNEFFLNLQQQNDQAAAWTDSSVAKMKQVLVKILVENGYLDSVKSEELKPVLINTTLENAIRASGDTEALKAFNCFF